MPPVVAFGKPDDLVRRWQVAPVDAPIAGFEKRLGLFLEDVSHRARGRVGDAQLFVLVIARGRHERDGRPVRAPLHVAPIAAACDVVAQRGAVLVGLHLESDYASRVDVDDDALDHGDGGVARQRVLPRLQRRVTGRGLDEIHLAVAPLILLKRSDLLRVRRPEDDRPIAARPAGIVGGVAEILDAVSGELRLLCRGDVTHPQVPVADEHGALSVRRRHVVAWRRSSAPAAATSAGTLAARRQIAGRARLLRCVDENRLAAAFRRHAVPETIVWKPCRTHAAVQHERRGVVREEALGASVIGGRQRAWRVRPLLADDGRGNGESERERVSHTRPIIRARCKINVGRPF